MRLFVGLELPLPLLHAIGELRGGLPDVTWQSPESYHLTLHFIGEVTHPHLHEEIHHVLSAIRATACTATGGHGAVHIGPSERVGHIMDWLRTRRCPDHTAREGAQGPEPRDSGGSRAEQPPFHPACHCRPDGTSRPGTSATLACDHRSSGGGPDDGAFHPVPVHTPCRLAVLRAAGTLSVTVLILCSTHPTWTQTGVFRGPASIPFVNNKNIFLINHCEPPACSQ